MQVAEPHPVLTRTSSAGVPRLFIDRLDRGYDDVIERGFAFLGASAHIGPQDRVAIKPNLTFPVFRPGVMTNPEAVEALLRYLTNYTSRITVCEADSGGYNRFSMTQVFQEIGLDKIAKRYGARLVNLSHEPSRPIRVRAGLRRLAVPMPTSLLDDTDLFITLPVPKVHVNTRNSGAIKNQWGTIQNPADRLRLHPYFKEVVYAINKIHRRALAIVDGKWGLTRSGPLRGDAVELNWMLLSDNLFAADAMVSRLQGFSPAEIPYLRWILKREGVGAHPEIACNTDWREFAHAFELKREWTDYPGLIAFRSRVMAYLGYESPLARPLHKLLYKFREPFY
jgi:uncharacterized protein (DUF362 family)